MRITVITMAALAMQGCAGFGATYPATSQPRALGIGGMQPNCFILCIQNVSFTDAEGSGNARGGDNSQSASVAVGMPGAPIQAPVPASSE